jgi:hypothetical protein
MAAGISAMSIQSIGFRSPPVRPENTKRMHADVILIVISVLNLSSEEHRLKKGEAWLSLG